MVISELETGITFEPDIPVETVDLGSDRFWPLGGGIPSRHLHRAKRAQDVVKEVRARAQDGLPRFLRSLCAEHDEPDGPLSSPVYFPDLMPCLLKFIADQPPRHAANLAPTTVAAAVCATLDYARSAGCLTLAWGRPRIGKSFAARNWCDRRPGRARYMEVPPSGDQLSFLREVASCLGIEARENASAAELRVRIDEVLRGGELMLVFDEAQRLWPPYKSAHPARIEWLMSVCNRETPAALIALPEFFSYMERSRSGGWGVEQLRGRLRHVEALPDRLSEADLLAVARAQLPGLPERCREMVAIAASRAEAPALGYLEAVAMRSTYIANQKGRAGPSEADLAEAIGRFVHPAQAAVPATIRRRGLAARPPRAMPVAEQSQSDCSAPANRLQGAGPSGSTSLLSSALAERLPGAGSPKTVVQMAPR